MFLSTHTEQVTSRGLRYRVAVTLDTHQRPTLTVTPTRPLTAGDHPNTKEVRKRARLLLDRLFVNDDTDNGAPRLKWHTDDTTGTMWTLIYSHPHLPPRHTTTAQEVHQP